MTKKQFVAVALSNNCSPHYEGKARTMHVFGSEQDLKNLIGEDFKEGAIYSHKPYRFNIVAQPTTTTSLLPSWSKMKVV
jgi:hypothetical protein